MINSHKISYKNAAFQQKEHRMQALVIQSTIVRSVKKDTQPEKQLRILRPYKSVLFILFKKGK